MVIKYVMHKLTLKIHRFILKPKQTEYKLCDIVGFIDDLNEFSLFSVLLWLDINYY